MQKVNILGTEYEVLEQSEKDNPKLRECVGLCEQYSKKIVVNDMENLQSDIMTVENLNEYKNKVMRHEVIHAFLGESGLRHNSEWAENEEMVDWLAIQAPKLFDVFLELCIM